MNIADRIYRDEEDFEEPIRIAEGVPFNHPDTINRIVAYNNSSFTSDKEDATGFEKFFLNINLTPCEVARKSIEFDTKDFRFMTDAGGTALETWFLEQDFKYWAKQEYIGKFLNGIFKRLPRFGSVVVKTIGESPNFVDLRNFIIEPSADSLEDANYIIEKHRYTPSDFAKTAELKGWKNKDEVLKSFRKTSSKYIEVVERYGELTKEEIDDGSQNEYQFTQAIFARTGSREEEQDKRHNEGPRTVDFKLALNEMERDEMPYEEFHMNKQPGRWLGKGITERLFDPQHRINELINLQIKGSYYASLNLWQTLDTDVERNLLSDVANGDVLEVEEGIEQIPMEQQNLQSLMQEQQQWLNTRDELSFSSEIQRGGKLPSGTTLGSIKKSSSNTSKYFGIIRENLALDLKEYFKKHIIPQFEGYAKKEHYLLLTGDKLNRVQKLQKQKAMEQWRMDFYQRENKVPSRMQEEYTNQFVDSQLGGERERSQKIEKGFYENFDYKFDIVITGESRDTQVQSANRQMALQAITSDPSVLQDPAKKALFFKILEAGGINPQEIMDAANEQGVNKTAMGQQMQQLRSTVEATKGQGATRTPSNPSSRGGGGVARPQMPSSNQGGQTEQRI